jgi:hypothetical protein
MVAAACLVLGAGCSEEVKRGDGGIEEGGTASCPGGIDKSVDPATAVKLEAGKEVTGYVCPVKDQDFYKVTVPAGSRLLKIELQATVDVTNVQLTYLILDASGKTAGTAPVWSAGGMRSYVDFHCLPPGDYTILVKDDGDDGKDGNNPYKLKYSTEADPDGNEPNDTAATAKDPGKQGSIACKGDRDYFKASVGANQLLEVKLTTAAASKVDLKYTIYDDQNQAVATDGIADGSKGATNLSTIHALPKAGAYTIAVEDANGDDSDPKSTYTLALATKAEPDANDQGARNDTPATATKLDYGACQGGCSKTGQIASKADVDYYKLEGLPAGISPDNMAVIEVTVDFGASSVVDPQIGLVYPDANSPCTKDNCCRVLKGTCVSDLDCKNATYSCIQKEDIFCSDPVCAPAAGPGCVTEKACAGAVTCLPEKLCGGEQVTRYDDDGSKNGAAIRTAQPLLHPGPWYIRVNDFKNDDYEYGKGYTITVKVRMDPDGAKELNSEYLPILLPTSVKTHEFHAKVAKTKALKVTLGQAVTGHISYEGDQDWYVLDHPCPNADCNLAVSFSASGSCPGGTNGSGLEMVYGLHKDDGDPWFAFPQAPTPSQSGSYGGSAQCLYAFAGDGAKNYFISVSDLKHNNWSWGCQYSFTVTKTADGCNAPCVRKGNQNECSTP